MNHTIYAKCDGYLEARTGDYVYRCQRYDAVIDTILEFDVLTSDLTIADVGAGWTEFGHRLTQRGFLGRYIPYDGGIDGVDLQNWEPPATTLDWIVAIEFIEHIHDPRKLIETMLEKAAKGVVVTTPNSNVVDTLAMDSDHVVALTANDLTMMGLAVFEKCLFPGSKYNPGNRPDTLIGVRSR